VHGVDQRDHLGAFRDRVAIQRRRSVYRIKLKFSSS
jgi:hypothetical protein